VYIFLLSLIIFLNVLPSDVKIRGEYVKLNSLDKIPFQIFPVFKNEDCECDCFSKSTKKEYIEDKPITINVPIGFTLNHVIHELSKGYCSGGKFRLERHGENLKADHKFSKDNLPRKLYIVFEWDD